jgi:hypothetical protein
VDRFSRWPEAIPMAGATAEDCAKALLRGWIARFGVPSDLTSDRGPQFTSALWAHLNRLMGTAAGNTTAYHPQANGMVERLHWQLKDTLETRMSKPGWMTDLPFALLHMRTVWREDPDCFAADLTYGMALTLPGDFVAADVEAGRVAQPLHLFVDNLRRSMRELQPPPPLHHGAHPTNVSANLASTGWVYVRIDARTPALTRPYRGPYKVLETGDKAFLLDINGKPDYVSVDPLKVCYVKPLPDVLPTTRSGRAVRPPVRFA